MDFGFGKFSLVDSSDVTKGANVTTTGLYNSLNVVIRNSAGSIIDSFGGSGGSTATNYSLETGGNLSTISATIGTQNATLPTKLLLIAGRTDVTSASTTGVLVPPGVLGSDASGRPQTSSGNMLTRGYLYALNPVGTNASNPSADVWDRVMAGSAADGIAAASSGNNGASMLDVQPFLWNGSTNDRWYGDKTNGAWVNLKSSVSLTTTVTSGNITADTELPAAAALADGVSSTNVEPRVAADMQGLRPDGTANSDRAVLSKMFDMDTGAGTENNVGISLRKSASGGSVEYGSSSANAFAVAPNSYPSGATPETASSGNVGNTSAVATLATASGKTTYISGFQVTSTGATDGLAVNITVAGIVTGTMTYTYAAPAGALIMGQPLVVKFDPPIPASATNTTIVVTCPALGAGNTNSSVNAQGFQL